MDRLPPMVFGMTEKSAILRHWTAARFASFLLFRISKADALIEKSLPKHFTATEKRN